MATTWEAKGSYVFEGGNCIGICDTDNASTAQYERNARLMASAPDLLSIAERWAALDGGAWHVERHAREKRELMEDTRAAIAKATPSQA